MQPFHAMIYPSIGRAMSLQIAQTYAARIAKLVTPMNVNPAPPGVLGRLKVAFLSSDFGHHPLSHLMRSVFSMLDRTAIEAVIVTLNPAPALSLTSDLTEP